MRPILEKESKMDKFFKEYTLGNLKLKNRFVFPPIKTAYGSPQGMVTDRQINFYRQIAKDGPGIIIMEPVAVTPDGREHPKQLCVHLPESSTELKKIVDIIHAENRLACLHLNHAGAAANPKVIGKKPKAPSEITCSSSEQMSDPLSEEEIIAIVLGFKLASEKAIAAGFDLIEIQAGHGYLLSQFLNRKINKRADKYGKDRLQFAREVFSAVREGAPDLPIMLRISGSEMSPEFGIEPMDLAPLLSLASTEGIIAIHAGMGSVCFSPPWYFHHASLPEKPQTDALSWLRKQTSLPIIAAGRMGRREKIQEILDQNLADMVALGRPLISDPDTLKKWQEKRFSEVTYCGYCLQGCLHRVKSGEQLGCNLNPAIGYPELSPTDNPLKVLIAGSGPAGLSAAHYLSKRGHEVTLAEKESVLGGQFHFTWQAPGKEKMKAGLNGLETQVKKNTRVLLETEVNSGLIEKIKPDMLVWATGVKQNIPGIEGLGDQNSMTSLEYFRGEKTVKGPRILVIGAGRTGLEIVEKLGKEGYDIVATKRSDPIGNGMDLISKKLTMMRIENMQNVTLMPHTEVKAFNENNVAVEKDSKLVILESFQTIILASGMLSVAGPDDTVKSLVSNIEVIGDAWKVGDIFNAVRAGYELAATR
jgi:2,4-dienoyl-CoA reductase-like NADH-dependent reductase (Old Yellow Enzyme family)/thioredoxin reductase